jgi:pimeloyl-ACP methyl ester carboxylesterase
MTNLVSVQNEAGEYRYVFKSPLDDMERALPLLGEFPMEHVETKQTYGRPSLFIAGRNSPYVPESCHDDIYRLFPRAEIIELATGHWVHAERPHEFIEEVSRFLVREA